MLFWPTNAGGQVIGGIQMPLIHCDLIRSDLQASGRQVAIW